MKTIERRHTKHIHQQFTLFFLFTITGNDIKDIGATSMSEALKSNTTLTALDLSCQDKREKTHKRHPSTNHSFFLHFTSTDNNIDEKGATSMSEALKSNTILTKLNMYGKDKKKTHTPKKSINNSLVFVSPHKNRQPHW